MLSKSKKPIRCKWSSFFGTTGPHIAIRNWDVNGEECNLPHSHEFLELCIVTEGNIPHETIHGLSIVSTGQLLVLRPGTWHGFGATTHSSGFNICFDENALRNYIPFIFYDPHINYLLFKAPQAHTNRGIYSTMLNKNEMQVISPLLNTLTQISLAGNRDEQFVEMIGYLLAALGILSKLQAIDSHDIETTPLHPSSKNIINQIEADLLKPMNLSLLANNAKISKSYAANLFKRDVGKTVSEYIMYRRSELAASLLLTTDKSVTEIAYDSGWEDPNYFTRCFKKIYGMSPLKYRNTIS